MFIVPPSLEDAVRTPPRAGHRNRPTSWRSDSATLRSSWRGRRTTTTSSPMRPGRSSGRRRGSTRSSKPSTRGVRHVVSAVTGGRAARREPPAVTLGLEEVGPAAPASGRASPAGRLVEVAVDAAGARGSTFTYLVPPALADLVVGEAVLVEFGRRQALGVVLADATMSPGSRLGRSSTASALTARSFRRWVSRSPARSPGTILRRRRSSSGRCFRPACSNGWSSWPSSRRARGRQSSRARARCSRRRPARAAREGASAGA